tara:strand:+ start:45956 stop:47221 length:1266 start_codon:yes stop_codon:yes gene_type:complete
MNPKLKNESPDIRDCRNFESSELEHRSNNLRIEFSPLQCAELQSISELYQSWMQLFQNDPHSSLDQHPDHVIRLIPIFQETHSHLPGQLMQCRREGKLIAAGILLPKTTNTKALKAVGPARLLEGYYLCGNSFLCEEIYQQDEFFLNHLLTTTVSFCEEQKAEFLMLEDLLINQPLNRTIPDSASRFLCYSNTEFQNRSLIHFPENPADYWNRFRPKSKIKQRKRLRQNGEMKLIRVTEPDQVADFLEAAHQISLNTWQTQRLGLRIKNDEKELEEMTFLAINGSLRSYLLMKADQPVAFKVGYQHKGVYRDLEIGFDLNYASTSPGEALLLLTLEDLIQHETPNTYDFGEGDAEYKQRYCSEITQSRSVFLFPNTLKNKSLLSYLKISRFIDRTMRKILKASGIYTALRQLVRYGKLGSR